ncbi:DMT family transporter [Candidatus Poriferisodalis sp.]|uniref:DMT family transporter n=1 Tax=Candidatus Poriferisodalis sp. TaxID=3101277 RepID=UPI003B5B61E7
MTDTRSDRDGRRLGWFLAASGMLLVSTDSLWVRTSEADALDIAFIVGVLSLVLFGAIAMRRPSVAWVSIRTHTVPLLTIGVLGALSQLTFISAITHTEIPHVVAIVAAAPVLAAAIAWFALRERTSLRVVVGITLTLAGIGLVVSDSIGTPNLFGDLLALVAVVAFAASTVVWRRHRDMSRIVGLALASALMVIATAFVVDLGRLDATAWAAVLAMGLVCNPLGHLSYSTASRYAPAGEVALFTPVETVAGIVWAAVFLSEYPTLTTVAGAIIVIFGVLYATVLDRTTTQAIRKA